LTTTIHLLHAGKPLCGFTTDYPRDWPEGNKWQPFDRLDGGLAGETGILTREISQPEKWRACRGCAKASVELLIATDGWKWGEGEDFATLLEGFGLKGDGKST
jgi:hypothetical protein